MTVAGVAPVTTAIGASGPSSMRAAADGGLLQVGYGASLGGAAGFEAAMARASAAASGAPAAESAGLRALMRPIESIDQRADSIGKKAAQFINGVEMTPSDVVMMTVRCQEFMFHCQLTSNAANRVSDGLQQLFRQQG